MTEPPSVATEEVPIPERVAPAITVMLSTHNGASTLPRMLDGLTKLQVPPGGWKLVVVDNDSTDGTPEILQRYADRLPLTCVSEKARGKNKALNTALSRREGDLIVLTDDDIVPSRDWLLVLQRAADDHPEYSVFGGRIVPLWLQEPAPWLLELIPTGMTYALTPEDQLSGPIAARNVWGPNMAVRAAVFAGGLRFNEAIGPTEGAYIMGSETEFTTRLERMGHRCWHVREAVVQHIIRPHQVDPHWIIARAYRAGRGEAAKRMANDAFNRRTASARIAGVERWRYRKLVEVTLGATVCRLLRRRQSWFRYAFDASLLKGYVFEILRQNWAARYANRRVRR